MTRPTLYHGTRVPFGAGGLLLPRAEHGGPGTTAPLNPGREQPPDADRWVYLTTSLEVAWVYAWHAPGSGRPRVLVIRSAHGLHRDPEHSASMDAWRAAWASVARVLRVPAVSEAAARSGWLFDSPLTTEGTPR